MRFRKLFTASLLLSTMLIGSSFAMAEQFKWGGAFSITTLEPHLNDPVRRTVLSNIYEPLVENDTNGEYKPLLATSWEQVASDRWRFVLRQNVKFHDGSDFNADDVIFTFERARHPNATMHGALARVAEVIKVDDYTVDIRTTVANAILPKEISAIYIMSKDWSEANDAISPPSPQGAEESFATRNSNGTGPFVQTQLDPGISLELTVNPEWWGGKRDDAMTGAKYITMSEQATQMAALASGEIDMITGISPAVIGRLEQVPGIRVESTVGTTTMQLAFDLDRDELLDSDVKGANPFKDYRVREAINLAINVPALVDRVMRGYGMPNDILAGPTIVGVTMELMERQPADVERARELMKEAGYADGFRVGFDCTEGNYVNDSTLCQAISTMLASIGINANVILNPGSSILSKFSYPAYGSSFFMYGYTPTVWDSAPMFDNWMRSRDLEKKRVGNRSGWSNPDFDALTESILLETDQDKRLELMQQAWSIVKEERSFIGLFTQMSSWAFKENIEAQPDPAGRVWLSEIRMKN